MPKRLSGLLQQLPEGGERLGVVDLAGRVVGRVDDDRLGLGGDRRFDRRQVEVEVVVGVDNPADPAMVVEVEVVLDKVGGEQDDLLAGVEQGLEDDVEAAGGAAGHQHVTPGDGHPLLGRHPCRQGLPHPGVAAVRHVAVGARALVDGDPADDLGELRRRRQIGVAEAEIADIVRPEFGLHSCPFLEHLADP